MAKMLLKEWPVGYDVDGRYTIIKRLALTERCEIYLAKELHGLQHNVVIKRLKSERLQDLDARERFAREANVLRRIHHQTILPIYDIKLDEDECYFITAYANKGSLQEHLHTIPDHKMDVLEAVDIAICVCQGLDVAHKQGIVHRDVKPGNILLFREPDESLSACLSDFSIASVITDKALTVKDTQLCTPLYAAPEQLTGDLVDSRSDLYSWGLTFFEMLTGESPDKSLKPPVNAVFFPAQAEFPLDFFTERGVSFSLATVLHKALLMDRTRRYQSASDILVDLNRIKGSLTSDPSTQTTIITVDPNLAVISQTPSAPQTLTEWIQIRRYPLALTLFFSTILCVALGWATGSPCERWPSACALALGVPLPTPTLLPTATASTTPTPSPTPTNTTTPTPTTIPLPPTATPVPPTATPTNTPAPTNTPRPTASPTGTPSPTPTPTPALPPVGLQQPINNQVVSDKSVSFEWSPTLGNIPNDAVYKVFVRPSNETAWKNSACEVSSRALKLTCTFTVVNTGEYMWKVALFTAQGEQLSQDSNVQKFKVETETSPGVPIPPG